MLRSTQFRLLGPFDVCRAGDTLSIGRRRERCLLGVLLLSPGQVVPRNRLIDLLWEDDPPPSARASLHTSISRLRSLLADDAGAPVDGPVLASRDGGYVVEVDPQTVDAHRFRRLLDQARSTADPGRRVDLLRMALGLWRGPVLADDAWPRLRDRIGADYAELHLRSVAMLADAQFACDREHEVVSDLTALTAEHPLHEPLVARLMLALWRCGRPAEAIDAFERSRRWLADALGVDPGPDLRRLHTAILRQEEPVYG